MLFNLLSLNVSILKKQENTLAPPTSLTTSPKSNPSTSSFSSPLLSPATKTASLLDHGLPSPPVEYQKKQQVDTMDIDMDTHQDEVDDDDEDDAVSTISHYLLRTTLLLPH
ncbi:unnamed protein product [Absidia cylindrospora]